MDKEYSKQRELLNRQVTECIPLIEIERCGYIRAEYGRVQSVMGSGYWDKEREDQKIFHGKPGDDLSVIEDKPRDPYDITIEELDWMTRQYKRIERCGTETYMNFFNMDSEDKERIALLARMWHKLTHETLCSELEVRTLREGHEAFLARKLVSPVKVIP